MSEIVLLSASPSASSRSRWVARSIVEGAGRPVRAITPVELGAEDVLAARETPSIAAFVGAVREAAAIVLATPVYKASYAGALKAVLDLVPHDALRGTPWLAIATAKAPAHLTPTAHALSELASFFEARVVASPLSFRDDELAREGEGYRPDMSAAERIARARDDLRHALRDR